MRSIHVYFDRCVTYKNGSSPNTLDSLKWEYCDVPYCRNDTKIALKEQAADANNTVFPYTTCEAQKDVRDTERGD